MLKKIYHLGVAVRSLEEAIPFYRDTLGLGLTGIEEVPAFGVKVAFLEIGASKIELLEPTGDGMISRFLEAHGPGIHHVAYEVDDLEATISKCVAEGVRMVDLAPRRGAHGALVAFIDPGSSHSVVTELCQLEHEQPRRSS
jgi:methylmalonyl-CoA/ethylmalonyl-CoA epimerase